MFFGLIFFWKKYKSFLSLGLESSISQNIRNFFRVSFFIFWARKLWDIRTFSKKFYFPKYKKSFFWENIRTFLMLGLKSSISRNIKTFLWAGFFRKNIKNLRAGAGKCARYPLTMLLWFSLYSFLNWKYPFWVNLDQELKIASLSWIWCLDYFEYVKLGGDVVFSVIDLYLQILSKKSIWHFDVFFFVL